MSMFQVAVVNYGITYERFRDDFINAHTFHDDTEADCRNDHQVNLGRISSLLTAREDLVRKYGAKAPDRISFISCMEEFMLEKDFHMKTRHINFECHLNANALKVLTEAVNAIPVFKRSVSIPEVASLFNDCVSPDGGPLIANSNEVLAYFFSQLNFQSVISDRYQHILASNHLVLSSTGRKYLTQSDLAVALHHIEGTDSPVKSLVRRWVVLVKKETLGTE